MATVVYRHIAYDAGEAWATTPASMADSNLGTAATTTSVGDVQKLTTNTQPWYLGAEFRYNTTATNQDCYGATWKEMEYLAPLTHAVNQMYLRCLRVGSPGTCNVAVYAADGDGKPTGAALSTGTFDGNALGTSMGDATVAISAFAQVAGTYYCVVFSAPSGNASNKLTVSGTNTLTGARLGYSTDSGATWGTGTLTHMRFEMQNSGGIDLSGFAITKVEIRARSESDGANTRFELRPVYAAGDGNDTEVDPPGTVDWCAWVDITSMPNAPSPWTWAAVAALAIDVECTGYSAPYGANVYETEIQVTYVASVVYPGGTTGATVTATTGGGGPPEGGRATLAILAHSNHDGTGASEVLTPRSTPPVFGGLVPGGDNYCEFSYECDRREALLWKRQREKRWWVSVSDSLGTLVWRGRLWVCAVTDTGVDMRAYGGWHILSSKDLPYNQRYIATPDPLYPGGVDFSNSGAAFTEDTGLSYVNIQWGTPAPGDWGAQTLNYDWPFSGVIEGVAFTSACTGTGSLDVFAYAGTAASPELVVLGNVTAGGPFSFSVAAASGCTRVRWKAICTGGGASAGDALITAIVVSTKPDRDTSYLVRDVTGKVGGAISDSTYYIQESGVDLPLSQVYDTDQSGAEIITEMCKLGNSSHVPMYAGVFADLYMRFWPRKSTVTWRTRLSELVPGSLTLANDEELWTACYAVYTTVAGATARTSTGSNASLVALYGTRTYALQASVQGDVDAARLAQAEQLRDTFLAIHARMVTVAKFEVQGRVWDSASNERPLWHVKAGDVLEIDELKDETFGAAVCPDGVASFHLVEVVYDAGSGVLSCTPEGGRPELDVQVAQASL